MDKTQREIEALQGKLQVQQAAADQAQAEADLAQGEFRRISEEYAKELGQVGTAAEQIGGAPSGFVTIAEAERVMYEREARIREEFEQAVAAFNTKDGEVSEVAQSDIGEPIDVDDDEGWHKVEKGKRKSMLERSGRIVANKVKKLSKGATASSPFAKEKAAAAAKGLDGRK